MFESLSNRLESAFPVAERPGRITEINIATTVKEIRRALVDADVNYKIAKGIYRYGEGKSTGSSVLKSVSPGQLMVEIVEDS